MMDLLKVWMYESTVAVLSSVLYRFYKELTKARFVDTNLTFVVAISVGKVTYKLMAD